MVSMKDIAKELNLSRTTVSNILNNNLSKFSYKSETINRVLKKAEEMGYVPNNIAVSLKTGETKTFALVIPDISNDFYVNIIKEIERLTNVLNYSLIICITEESVEKENKYLKLLEGRMIEGVLIAPVSYTNSLLKKKYPFEIVCFDRTVKNSPYPSVSINNHAVAKKLTNYLLNESSKSPLFITGSMSDITNIYRLNGFKEALKERNVEFDNDNIIYEVFDDDTAFEKLNFFINQKGFLFDSIYLSSNYSIYGVLKVLENNNRYNTPIAGFENFKGAEFLKTKVFKVEQPESKIAQLAFEKLLTLLRGDETSDSIIKLK